VAVEVLENARGDGVRDAAEDGRRSCPEHPFGDLPAGRAIDPVVGDGNLRAGLECQDADERLERLERLATGSDVEAERRDPDRPVTELGEVFECQSDPAVLVGEDDVRRGPGDLTVEEHDRPRDRAEEPRETYVAVVDQRDGEGVDATGAKRLEREALAPGVPPRADDHHSDALAPQILLKHIGDATEDVVADRRNEQPDQEASRRSQATRRLVGVKIEPGDGVEDTLTCCERDVRGLVQHAGDRRLRDARLPGNIDDRDLSDIAACSTVGGCVERSRHLAPSWSRLSRTLYGNVPYHTMPRVIGASCEATMTDIDLPAEPGAPRGELLSPRTVGAYLVARGILDDLDGVHACELAGGVSNIVLAVSRAATRVVVKQALPRLRVAEEWLAKQERAVAEAEALRLAARLTPGGVPALLDVDPDRCVLTIAAAPDGWTTWKSRLLDGDADAAVASRLGELLAAWHRGTFGDEEVARVLGDAEAFEQLRVDPYYRTVARRRPELAAAIGSYLERMDATRVCLVHGDYSPKNVLVGAGVWVIDFEVAHVGDPAFDVAFVLNHLLLKRLHVPSASAALERCMRGFWQAYRAAVPAGVLPELGYALGHLGCLMVARIDGKSPAEYLSPAERDAARTLGSRLLLAPPGSLDELLETVRAGSR